MATGNRIRGVLDIGRLAALLAGPGSDTRSWIAMARVDDDPDAVRFDDGYGWIVDITFVSGELSGEGPVTARVLSPFGGADNGMQPPVSRNTEVVVAITDGDPNTQCVIIGCLHNPENSAFPATVNGETVNEAYAAANIVGKTASGLNLEMGPKVRVSAQQQATLEAPQIRLADDNAIHPYVFGDDLKSALDNFAAALVAANAYTSTSPVVASATLITATTTLASALTAALSTRIKGS